VRRGSPFAYVLLVMIGFYAVFNDDARNVALVIIGVALLVWSLRQIWIKRFRGLLAVTALCAVLAGVAEYALGSVPIQLVAAWMVFAGLWAFRETFEWLQRRFASAARRWRERPRFRWKRAPREKKLEPVTVAVPAPAGNVSAEEIIQRLIPEPEQRKAS